MFAQFRYRDGAKSGETRVVGNDFATLGRDPAADVSFDPATGAEVSIRHAAVFKQGGGFLIRDLGSPTGTFLNGQRVRGDRPLEVGDVIQLGPNGPTIEFGTAANPPHTVRGSGPPAQQPTPPGSDIFRPKPRPTDRVGRPRAPGRRVWPWLLGVALVIGAVGASLIGWRARQAAAALDARRVALQTRIDDLRNRLEQAKTPNEGLRAALSTAGRAVEEFGGLIAAAPRSASGLDSAVTAFDTLTARHQPLIFASAANPEVARGLLAGQTAAVIGEFDRGAAVSATGLVIRQSGDTAWLATIRQVAIDSVGIPATRFAVIFDGDRIAHLARLVRVHDTADVAILSVIRSDGGGAVAVSETPPPGAPVVVVGFPFGADSLGDWRIAGATMTASVATVVSASSFELVVHGYRVRAWPGGPIATVAGTVVGMATGGNGDQIRAIPIAMITRLVDNP